jgi:CheY-like chemotaxis protein
MINDSASDILIVDDEDSVRQLLKLMLRTLDVGVREATDGVEALDQIAKGKPSLVILDVMMPNMDGLTVLRRLRSNPDTETLPVLLFTAFRMTTEQAAELSLKPSMIMSKGNMSVRDIRATVNQVLQGAA